MLLVNISFGTAFWCTLIATGRSANVFQIPGAACFKSLLLLAPGAKCSGRLRFMLSVGKVTSLLAVMLANLSAPLFIPAYKDGAFSSAFGILFYLILAERKMVFSNIAY